MFQFKIHLFSVFLIIGLCSCKTLKQDNEQINEVPGDGLLGAKLMALNDAMDNLSEDDRRFGTSEYLAYGIEDSNSIHNKAMIKILADRKPPIVDASEFYTRSSNSQWMSGRPVMKWVTEATKDPRHPLRANVLVGWMHSQIINQFYTYKLEYDGVVWTILDVDRLDLDYMP